MSERRSTIVVLGLAVLASSPSCDRADHGPGCEVSSSPLGSLGTPSALGFSLHEALHGHETYTGELRWNESPEGLPYQPNGAVTGLTLALQHQGAPVRDVSEIRRDMDTNSDTFCAPHVETSFDLHMETADGGFAETIPVDVEAYRADLVTLDGNLDLGRMSGDFSTQVDFRMGLYLKIEAGFLTGEIVGWTQQCESHGPGAGGCGGRVFTVAEWPI